MSQIVVLNPNSSAHITESLKSIHYNRASSANLVFLTAPPSSPLQIVDEKSEKDSTKACLPFIEEYIRYHSVQAILIACFSDHELVHNIYPNVKITGIFEASITKALSYGKPFGIVTTAVYWEDVLDSAARRISDSPLFKGVKSTGLSVLELHDISQDIVKQKVQEATRTLMSEGVSTVILGCAGMTGMEEWVGDVLCNKFGQGNFQVIDSVIAGVEFLDRMIANKPAE